MNALRPLITAAFFALPCVVSAEDFGRQANEKKQQLRVLVGKTFWIEKPNGKGLELCPSTVDRFNECKRVFNTSFKVIGMVEVSSLHDWYQVKMTDGRTGYINVIMRDFFQTEDPVAARVRAKEECDRRGQPKIGMTVEEAKSTCWGSPGRVLKTTTASGVREDFIYGPSRILQFENGRLVAIHE